MSSPRARRGENSSGGGQGNGKSKSKHGSRVEESSILILESALEGGSIAQQLDHIATPPRTNMDHHQTQQAQLNRRKGFPRKKPATKIRPGQSIMHGNQKPSFPQLKHKYQARRDERNKTKGLEGGGQGMSMSRNTIRNENSHHTTRQGRGQGRGQGRERSRGYNPKSEYSYIDQAVSNQSSDPHNSLSRTNNRKRPAPIPEYASTTSKRKMKEIKKNEKIVLSHSSNSTGICTMDDDEFHRNNEGYDSGSGMQEGKHHRPYSHSTPPSSQERRHTKNLEEWDDEEESFDPSLDPSKGSGDDEQKYPSRAVANANIQSSAMAIRLDDNSDSSDDSSRFSSGGKNNLPQQDQHQHQPRKEIKDCHPGARNETNTTSSYFPNSKLSLSKKNNASPRGRGTAILLPENRQRAYDKKLNEAEEVHSISSTSVGDEDSNNKRGDGKDLDEHRDATITDHKKSRCDSNQKSILERADEVPVDMGGQGKSVTKRVDEVPVDVDITHCLDSSRYEEDAREEEGRVHRSHGSEGEKRQRKKGSKVILESSGSNSSESDSGKDCRRDKQSSRKRRLNEKMDRERQADNDCKDVRKEDFHTFMNDSNNFEYMEFTRSDGDRLGNEDEREYPQKEVSIGQSSRNSADIALSKASQRENSMIKKGMKKAKEIISKVTPRYGNSSESRKRSKNKVLDDSMDAQSPRRSRRKAKKKTPDIIVLSSDESESDSDLKENRTSAQTDDGLYDTDVPNYDPIDSFSDEDSKKFAKMKQSNNTEIRKSPRKSARLLSKFGARQRIEVSRIAVGNKIFCQSCSLSYQPGIPAQFVLIEYKKKNGDMSEHRIGIDEIQEFKYFIPVKDDEKKLNSDNDENGKQSSGSDSEEERDRCCYMVIRVPPTDNNRLSPYSNAYLTTEKFDTLKDDGEQKDLNKRYVVMEMQSRELFDSMLESMMKGDDCIKALISSGQLNPRNKHDYISAFIHNDARNKKRARAAKVKKYKSDETILVYPFEASPAELDKAAENLIEASGRFKDNDVATMAVVKSNICPETEKTPIPVGKTHMVTVHGEDYERLEPFEFLNDTLIDFWLKWITRKEVATESDIYTFTTQFFSKLEDDGPDSVSSWTAKKGVDIFQKKLIFVPVNKDIHWSLFVIVNPGEATRMQDFHSTDQDEEKNDIETDVPFILFLDSLRAHKPRVLAKHIYNWLNSEASRSKKFPANFFNRHNMPLCFPKAPTQDNSWDCGVFVCRFAYAVLHMRDRTLKAPINQFVDKNERDKLIQRWVDDSPEFHFDMKDIKRLRKEIAKLIENLSAMYSKSKQEQRIRRQKMKLEERKEEEKKDDYKTVKGAKEEAFV